ncbi:MAG: putative hydroxymethylpyrimidine transporter CytX [Ruminococcaceae bacterium]|nr:putative hydroxymethylpyrimidine transporter CytX [Oscillospiraceae bacterium]
MQEKKTSTFSNGLIWFGAAVSIAEIMTGTLFAPLGFGKGLLAIVVGHVIGCVLLFLAGLIGARTGKSAMETVKMSFGGKGSLLFSVLNVLQLVGWTAVMIAGGASAAAAVIPALGNWGWCLIIGALIIVWVLIGVKNLGKVNIVAMAALFVLTIVLSVVIFNGGEPLISSEALGFGAAIELSIAMPLSWLPLISDYTRSAKKPFGATLTSTVVYFAASCWMYIIGMGAALFTGESDIAAIMLKAGLGIAALIIIIFSTVTTTFLDVYSAGVSAESITAKLKEKPVAIVVGIIGMVLAIFAPVSQFEAFLYLISSVFAPMIVILIVDYFMLKKDSSAKKANWVNLVLWLVGFVVYRVFLAIDLPIGSTIPVMVITGLLCLVVNKVLGAKKHAA